MHIAHLASCFSDHLTTVAAAVETVGVVLIALYRDEWRGACLEDRELPWTGPYQGGEVVTEMIIRPES